MCFGSASILSANLVPGLKLGFRCMLLNSVRERELLYLIMSKYLQEVMLVSLKWIVMRILHTFLPLVVALVYRYVCRIGSNFECKPWTSSLSFVVQLMYYRSALPRIKQVDFLGIWLFRPFQKFYCRARVKYISNQIIPNHLPLFMTKVFARTLISSSKTTLVNTARTAGLARLLSCNVKSGAKFDSGAGDWHVYATVTRQLAREAQISSGTQGLAQSLVLGWKVLG